MERYLREENERCLRLPLWLKAVLHQKGDEGAGEHVMVGSNYTSVQ